VDHGDIDRRPGGNGSTYLGDLLSKASILACGAAAVIGIALAPAAASASTLGAPGSTPTPTSSAGSDPGTTVTFAVTSGALTMTAPLAADLGSGAPGDTISGALGAVTVTDDRALLNASWTATAASTDYTTGGGTTAETIPATDLSYAPGAITTTGIITATGTDITMSNSPQTVVAGTDGTGNNTASWDPTISVAVPAAAVFGTYTGTITHSVS
jgi:hypothetical protein